MAGPLEEHLARALLAQGLISEAQLQAAREAQERCAAERRTALFLGTVLIGQGVLTEQRLAEVLRENGWASPAACAGTVVDRATAPAEAWAETGAGTGARCVAVPPAPEGRPFGRYRLLAELGRGGMGVVWRAYDTELRREVALKTLLGEGTSGPDTEARFLREARTAATLEHPGIVPIHDVGSIEGVPYLAMALVRGSTLGNALAAGRLAGMRERAEAVRQAAEAVAHAHGRRVIHRDLKPGNLLLDEAGRVLVSDFGLARRLDDGTRLTVDGQVLGTPHYMPPEQIEGEWERVGPAADVYALGAVLYETLTGRPPFEGATLPELMGKALLRDPERPRALDRRVPEDLETICLRALQKEPERRYPTARELAEDLGRYLRGEAIEARRETWVGRGLRWARRRKWLTGLAAAALLAAAAAGSLGVQAAAAHREQRRLLAEQLSALRANAALAVDAVLIIRRAGGKLSEAEDRFVPALREAAARVSAEAPALAEPHYHLARMLRAVVRQPEALAELERALAKEPEHAPALYQHAVLKAEAYSLEFEAARFRARARRATGPDPGSVRGAPGVDELERDDAELAASRHAAVDALERLRVALDRDPRWADHPDPLLRVNAARRRCAEALLVAYRAHDWETARVAIEAALAADSTLEEAYEALFFAAVRFDRPDDAITACTRGLQVDPGYPRHWTNRGTVHLNRGVARMARGEDPGAEFRDALADLTRAVELDRRSGVSWDHRAGLHLDIAHWHTEQGLDATADFQASVEDWDRSLDLDPADPEALAGRGSTRIAWAQARQQVGADPDPQWTAASADLERAVELDPSSPEAWVRLGCARQGLAQCAAARKEDAAARFASARDAYRRSLELDASSAEAWLRLGSLENARGLDRAARGEDPGPAWQAALDACARALEIAPEDADCWLQRGTVLGNRASRRRRIGEDAREECRRAIEDLEQAVRRNPTVSRYFLLLAEARAELAQMREERGESGDEELSKALADADRAVERTPGRAAPWTRRADVRTKRAVIGSARGRDPVEDLRFAADDLARALSLQPEDSGILTRRGAVRANLGQFRAAHGEDPESDYLAALADFNSVLSRQPDDTHLVAVRGALYANWASQLQSEGKDPEQKYAAALADLDHALELDPRQADVRRQRAAVKTNLGMHREAQGGDPRALFEGAIVDLDEALAGDSGPTEGWVTRGVVRTALGEALAARGEDPEQVWREARDDFDRALAIDPRHAMARFRRASLLVTQGDAERRRGLDPRPAYRAAQADLEATRAMLPDFAPAAETLADVRAAIARIDQVLPPGGWLEKFVHADGELQAGRWEPAAVLYEAGLELHAAQAAPGGPADSDRQPLAMAHYHLACTQARRLVSAGDQAAALQDAAFEHLRAAMSLGLQAPDAIAAEEHLDCLHADPRWDALLQEMRER